jgi:hypothetical protein
MAKRLILGGLVWRLDENQDLKDLEANLKKAMEKKVCYTVVLADKQRLLVNGAGTEYALLWDNITEPSRPPVAEVSSRVGV